MARRRVTAAAVVAAVVAALEAVVVAAVVAVVVAATVVAVALSVAIVTAAAGQQLPKRTRLLRQAHHRQQKHRPETTAMRRVC